MSQSLPLRRKRSRWLRASLIAGVILFLVWLGYTLFGPPTPDAICLRTIQALETYDLKTLIALADPTEVAKLQLTESKVRGMLNETIWKTPYTGPHRYIRQDRPAVDQAMYEVRSSAPGLEHTVPLFIVVNDSPNHGWQLNLSELIYYSWVHQDLDLTTWKALEAKYDFVGVRETDGTYHFRKGKELER